MLANPDHKTIKDLAREMLFKMTECPDALQRICNELLPIARYENGLVTPNKRPPTTVYVELDGVMWRFNKSHKKWHMV